MKELKEKPVLQELTKEEAANTFGGQNAIFKIIYKDGKAILVSANR